MNSPNTLRQQFPFKIINRNTNELIWEYACITHDNKGLLVTTGAPASADNPSLEIGFIELQEHMKLC